MKPKKDWTGRLLTLMLPAMLASGCASVSPNSPPPSVVPAPANPPLPAQARQPKPPPICLNGCSKGLMLLRTELLKGLGEAIQQGDAAVATYLKGLTATTRYELHRSSVPELAAYLSAAIASIGGLEQRQASRPVEVPEDFPPGLREPLLRYKDKLERLMTRDTLFDIGADMAGSFVPGGSVAVKVIEKLTAPVKRIE